MPLVGEEGEERADRDGSSQSEAAKEDNQRAEVAEVAALVLSGAREGERDGRRGLGKAALSADAASACARATDGRLRAGGIAPSVGSGATLAAARGASPPLPEGRRADTASMRRRSMGPLALAK
jgi:hypothetical protein